MSKIIVWSKIEDAAFRVEYLAITGERLQRNPPQNSLGTLYMAGSGRISDEQAALLQNHPGFASVYIGDRPPAGWVDAEDSHIQI